MALIQRMTALRSRLNKIPVRLGVPTFNNLLIRHVELGSNLLETHADKVFAAVKVTTVSPKYVGMPVGGGNSSIMITQNDFHADVPREYSRDFIEKDVLFYVINPPMANGEVLYNPITGEPASGIFCKLLTIDDHDATLWKLILRGYRDRPDGTAGNNEISY